MILLAPLSLLYRVGLAIDRTLKTLRRKTLPRPVISIGNISVGGTGKTPLVIKLLSDLKSWGFHPAVLTRGYKSENGFSDEVALLMKYHPDVPIGTGADRFNSAHDILSRARVDVFVLDDGFQHWALARNLDIVCVDATNPWAGGHLLPWGRLREPKSALQRADIIVATRLERVSEDNARRLLAELAQVSGGKPVLSSSFRSAIVDWKSGQTLVPSGLKGKKLVALSAIAAPQAFEEGIEKTGAVVIPLRFRDHHHYTQADLVAIEELANKQSADVVTTEKDLVKLERTRWGKPRELPFRVFVAVVHHEFPSADEKIWRQAVLEKISTSN